MDPDFYTEETVHCDDSFDEIYDNGLDDPFEDLDSHFNFSDFDPDVEQEIKESLYPDQLDADQLALAMAFGEFTANENNPYDIDENTDKENWENTMRLYPLHKQHNLSTFEQYINGITSGQCKGPWIK